MTDLGLSADSRIVWERDLELMPAHAWRSKDGRYSIVWDPEGFWLWRNTHEPLGIYRTLKAAKSRAVNDAI